LAEVKIKNKNKRFKMTDYQVRAVRSNYSWRQNRALSGKLEDVKKFGNISRSVLAIVLLLSLGLVYVSQATKAGSLAGPINDMEAKVTSLKEENQSLSVEVAKMQSLDELKKSEVAAGLSTPSEARFVD
jgi:cell division protein FtsL